MSDIKVIRVEPLDIPADIVWHISATQHIAMKDFYVYVQEKENKMYVNKSVPKKDIEKFIEVMTFPGRYFDDDSEIGQVANYIFKKYGFAAWDSLTEYHRHKKEQEDDQRAKDQLQEILPLIEEIMNSDHPAIHYNESLIYEVLKKGRDREGRTPRNIIGYDYIYAFYLGCLVGTGKVNADDYSLDESGNVLDYYYKISEMLEHIDIQEMPRIYGYLKEMYFSEQEGGAV